MKDIFKVEASLLFIAPTADVSLLAYHKDEMLLDEDLLLKHSCFSNCG